ncbi:uncharacterized protein LOC143567671 isoform X2 [Bidens hawaiensis]|uniref:uncharacterized protein LOC143567671 isoform X2 n=1 Tax=Bidens hawaiensis TaxID=980011 RepID=UPI00404A2A06
MRFKTGRRVEITNKEAPASLRKISRNNKVEPSFCLKIHQNDARVRKPKRASPFGSLHPKSKKVKLAENDCGQSQRHSFKKSDNWRHASLLPKGPNEILVRLTFSLSIRYR